MVLNDHILFMRETREEDIEVGPKNKMRVGVVMSIILAASTLVGSVVIFSWNASAFASRMSTDMSWVKMSLSTLVTKFDQMDQLRTKVENLEKFGSDAARKTSEEVRAFEMRINQLENYGTKADQQALSELSKEVATLRKEIEMHEAIDRSQRMNGNNGGQLKLP